jgi:dihydrodipicolinate synthase/N-acetylneuraminate lyase
MTRERLLQGLAIPAHPLALTKERKLDERHQRALTRYYLASGAGGIAVGVHTTQFAIRNPDIGLFAPVLELAREEMKSHNVMPIAGVCGHTPQAIAEATLARRLGYEAALLSYGGLGSWTIEALLEHTRAIAEIIPVIGFYLQSAVGGRVLPIEFWRSFAEIPNVVAIKIAAFDRYQTLDVIRAVAESGRGAEIALYTGNDDNIVADLCTTYRIGGHGIRMAGGLLGHWSVWTRSAVEIFRWLYKVRTESMLPAEILTIGQKVTDMNAAIFDPAHCFHGCIAGVNEVLARQGLMAGNWCLDPEEQLSPGQGDEITRVERAYADFTDREFILEHRDRWLS